MHARTHTLLTTTTTTTTTTAVAAALALALPSVTTAAGGEPTLALGSEQVAEGAGAALADEEYAAVVAYLLERNGLEPGYASISSMNARTTDGSKWLPDSARRCARTRSRGHAARYGRSLRSAS